MAAITADIELDAELDTTSAARSLLTGGLEDDLAFETVSPANSRFEGAIGTFEVGESGLVEVDFLFDGGAYEGQLAIFSLAGMDDLSQSDFVQEAAVRSLSGTDGQVVILDAIEGAQFTGELGEPDINSGQAAETKTLSLAAGTRFALMLVPNGTMEEVLSGQQSALFSLSEFNPGGQTQIGQAAEGVFAFEDILLDRSDRDFNDIIFRVTGATSNITNFADLIDLNVGWISSSVAEPFLKEPTFSQDTPPADPIAPPTDELETPGELPPTEPTEPPAEETPIDTPSVDNPPTEAPSEEMPVEDPTEPEQPADEPSAEEPTESPEEPPAEDPTEPEQPTIEEPTEPENPTEPAEEPPIEEPAEPKTEEPPAEELPVEEPPTEELPVEEPTEPSNPPQPATISAISQNVAKFNDNSTEAEIIASGAQNITIGTQTIYIGTEQVTSINQNPIIRSFDSANPSNNWTRRDLETSGTDGRGLGLLWTGSGLYGVFSVDGTQTDGQDFRRATGDAKQAWLKSFGSGQGKIAVLGQIDLSTGALLNAAHLSAVNSDGRTNSLFVTDAAVNAAGNIVVQAQSFFSPRQPDGSAKTKNAGNTEGSPFDYTVEITSDLSEVISTFAPGWT